MNERLPAHLFFQFTLLASQAGSLVLLVLARFGQQPPESLPLPALIFFAAALTGPLHAASRRFSGRAFLAAAALAVPLAGILNLALLAVDDHSALWLAAPAVTLLFTAALRLLPRRTADMLSPMTVYTACTVLANYTLDSFLPLGGFFLVNVGTFFFGITFTQRDRVHQYGRANVYRMIAFAAVANVAMSLLVGTPIRYVTVAFISIIVSETANTEVFERLLHRPWFQRVAGSNAVSAPLDTLIFPLLAFSGEPFATPAWLLRVIVTDVLVKYGASLLAAFGITAWLHGRSTIPDSGGSSGEAPRRPQ